MAGRHLFCWTAGALLLQAVHAPSALLFPTANRFLIDPPEPEKFFAPTPGKTWQAGSFGCVRSEGAKLHEGIDILFLQRDRKGEPMDPVLATAPGTVAYVNRRGGLSNYGKYVILYHKVEGLEFYSLYAHLSQIDSQLETGKVVQGGQALGIMGRTSNTQESIGKDRAHLHFELGFLVNQHFALWLQRRFPGQRNDHGLWNGRNLLAIDPAAVLQAQAQLGSDFRFFDLVSQQTELCKVLVRHSKFPWVTRFPRLVQPNVKAQQEGIAGYELSLNFNGIPFRLTPRAASEIPGKEQFQLLEVNEAEAQRASCRRLLKQTRGTWRLAPAGEDLLSLLTYTP